MAADLEQIRQNYAQFDDVTIENIAKYEVASLEAGVVSILKEEVRKRGLKTDLNKLIEAQAIELTARLERLKSRIAALPCPDCGGRTSPLVGALTREVTSFLIVTSHNTGTVIACPGCAGKKRTEALFTTLLAGWWSPEGFISTIHALVCSVLDRFRREEQSDSILTAFVIQNLGEIGANLDSEAILIELVRRANSSEH